MEPYDLCEDLQCPEVEQAVWDKALVVEGYDKTLYRKDFAGAWIMRSERGNTDSPYGWEIDHVYPEALGGENHFINLRPMHWRNNRSKSDDYPRYKAVVVSENNGNVERDTPCKVNDKLVAELNALYQVK